MAASCGPPVIQGAGCRLLCPGYSRVCDSEADLRYTGSVRGTTNAKPVRKALCQARPGLFELVFIERLQFSSLGDNPAGGEHLSKEPEVIEVAVGAGQIRDFR